MLVLPSRRLVHPAADDDFVVVGSCLWTLVLGSDYINLDYIIHTPDPYFIYVISNSLVNFTNHVHKKFLSIVWFCCQVSGHTAYMTSSHDLSWPMLPFFGMGICINASAFWMFSGKKCSVKGLCYKL